MADGDIRILESFDRYADAGSIGRMNAIWSNNHALVAGRYFGGKGVSMTGTGNSGTQTYAYIDDRIHAFTVGAAFKPAERTRNSILVCTGPSGQLTLGHQDNGRLDVYRGTFGAFNASVGGGIIAEGNKVDAIVEDIWQYVEFQVIQVAGANVAIVRAWVNGELCLENLAASSQRPGGFDGFGISRIANTQTAVFDDFYTREGPDRLGEIKIESIVPDGTVSNTLGTLVGNATAHGAVSENPVDGDTSYIAGINAGEGARFSMGDMTQEPNYIRAVQVRSFARKDETAYRSIKNVIKVEDVEATGQEQVLGTGYKFYRDIFPVNPKTGLPWTKSAVDAFNIGADIYA